MVSKSPNMNTPGKTPIALKPYVTNQTMTFKNGAKFKVVKPVNPFPKQLGTKYV